MLLSVTPQRETLDPWRTPEAPSFRPSYEPHEQTANEEGLLLSPALVSSLSPSVFYRPVFLFSLSHPVTRSLLLPLSLAFTQSFSSLRVVFYPRDVQRFRTSQDT